MFRKKVLVMNVTISHSLFEIFYILNLRWYLKLLFLKSRSVLFYFKIKDDKVINAKINIKKNHETNQLINHHQ